MKGLFTRRNLIRWGLLLLLAWTSVGLLLLRFHGGITVDDVATLEPERPWLAALILLGLFLLKSVDFLLHIGVLFAASGQLFPLAFALLLNLVGLCIASIPAYLVGRTAGPSLLKTLLDRYPKLTLIQGGRNAPGLLPATLLRGIDLPLQIVGLYLGVCRCPFGRYLLSTLLGIAPSLTAYTLLGRTSADPASGPFRLCVLICLLLSLVSLGLYLALKRKKRQEMMEAGPKMTNKETEKMGRKRASRTISWPPP